MKKLSFAIIATLLAGCAATGVQVSQEAATQFKEGVTTEAQIRMALGEPTSITISSGVKTINYMGAQYSTNAASFIPVVGLFAGGSDYSISTASYQINDKGLLEKASYTTSKGTSRMGSAPAQITTREPTAVK